MQQDDIVTEDGALNKTINIIDNGLKVGLDQGADGEIATSLFSLYNRMVRRLLQANLRNDYRTIGEVEGLLGNVTDTWKQISPKASSQEFH